MKNSAKGIVYAALNMYDNLAIGSPETVDEAVEQPRKYGLVLKVIESLWDYLSCEICFVD